MKSEIPKQFLELHKEVVLMHSIRQFYEYSKSLNLIVSLPEPYFDYWKGLCKKYRFKIEHELVAGGKTRFHSVKNALQKIKGEGYTAIHDGVRPMVTLRSISECYSSAKKNGSAIAAMDINFTLRKFDRNQNSKTVNRDLYKEIQTPQVFKNDMIKNAYRQEYRKEFTDDATVAEAAGYKIYTAPGSRENIKITNQEDLYIVRALMKARWS